MHLVAVYGSLKKGYYNHRGLGDDAEFLGKCSVCGVMYSNGSYPKLYKKVLAEEILNAVENAFEGEELLYGPWLKIKDHYAHFNAFKSYPLEVYRISDSNFNAIEAMEHGAGYVSEKIDTPYGEATIYYMPHEHFNSHDTWVEKY